MTRPLRDAIAEAMRRERLGLIRPLWTDADDVLKEPWRLRADVVIRILGEIGVIFASGASEPKTSPEVYRFPLVGGLAARVIRYDAATRRWKMISIVGTTETEEIAFDLIDAHIAAGMVLTDDPKAKAIPGLGRMLAATVEIHRAAAGGRDG